MMELVVRIKNMAEVVVRIVDMMEAMVRIVNMMAASPLVGKVATDTTKLAEDEWQ